MRCIACNRIIEDQDLAIDSTAEYCKSCYLSDPLEDDTETLPDFDDIGWVEELMRSRR